MKTTLRNALLAAALVLGAASQTLASPVQAVGKFCRGGVCTGVPPETVLAIVVVTTLADIAKERRCKARGLKLYCKGRR